MHEIVVVTFAGKLNHVCSKLKPLTAEPLTALYCSSIVVFYILDCKVLEYTKTDYSKLDTGTDLFVNWASFLGGAPPQILAFSVRMFGRSAVRSSQLSK